MAFRPPAIETGLLARMASGSESADDMRALVDSLLGSLGLPMSTPVLKDAVGALRQSIVVQDGAATVDPNVIIAFLMNRYDVDDDGRPGLRSFLGLQPTPWVFELNGGVPDVDISQQKIVADASVGCATRALGIVGRG